MNWKLKLAMALFLPLFIIGCNDEEDSGSISPELDDLTVDFNMSAQKILENEQINFTSIVSGNPDTYYWTFEGGNVSSSAEPNPSVTFSEAGKYQIVLEISREADNATISISKEITVCLPELTVDFTMSARKINENDQISFTSIVTGNPDTYKWTFEDGNISSSTEANPTVTFPDYGIKQITLEVYRNADDSTMSISKEVSVFPGEALLAFYPCNGNTDDLSGNEFVGTNNGAVLHSDRNGNLQSAYEFDGSSFISTSSEIDNNLDQGVSFSAWVNIKQEGSVASILSNYNGEGIGGDCAERIGFNLATTKDNGMRISYASDGNDYIGRTSSPNSVLLNHWNHIVATWNGDFNTAGFQIFINGVQADSEDFRDGFVDCGYLESEAPFRLGRSACSVGPCAYFTGIIDEIRIYNRVLSPSEILFLAQ